METYGVEDDFYRCVTCHRLLTQPELRGRFARLTTADTGLCPCGSVQFRPTNLRLTDWALPRVWAFAGQRLRDLGLSGVLANLRAGRAA